MVCNKELEIQPEVLDFLKPIPIHAGVVEGWKQVPIEENNEPIVPLGIGSDFPQMFTSSIYFGERTDSPYSKCGFNGSLITMFVREGVAERLVRAEKLLPPHFHLVIYDTYRTLDVQKSLFNRFASALAVINPTLSQEEILKYTQKFVSLPSLDQSRPSPHNTGGAVDLAIAHLPENVESKYQELLCRLDKETDDICRYILQIEASTLFANSAKLLNFGTAFDFGGVEASLRYYEEILLKRFLDSDEQVILENRRMLYNLMSYVGFGAYADEWWHFNAPETQMGAVDLNKPKATYGAANLSQDNISHERKRRKYWRRLSRAQENPETLSQDELLSHAYLCLMRIASASDGGKATSLEKAVELVPPGLS